MGTPSQRAALDRAHFQRIVRGKLRADLRQYLSHSEWIGKQGGRSISIPVPHIEPPRLRFQDADGGAQGGTSTGSTADQGQGSGGSPGQAGGSEAEHALEIEVPTWELASLLGEELGLPSIEPRGHMQIQTEGTRYTGITRQGPSSLRMKRRTLRAALQRSIAQGTWDPQHPVLMPEPGDERFRAPRSHPKPQSAAVLIHMMDVSGSMGREQKDMVRLQAFWLDTWLRSHYDSLEVVYMVHDAKAKLVDQDTFFHLRESGGTKISSAYSLCADLIRDEYPPQNWNIYPFHYSDGDNWSLRDTKQCLHLLEHDILPHVNQFAYSQVKSVYGSGQFRSDLEAGLGQHPDLVTADVADRHGVAAALKVFLGGGR